jgi:hypothetical protein
VKVMDLTVGTRLKSKHSGKACTITEINEKWDWFAVKWDRLSQGCQKFHELSTAYLYFTVVKPLTKEIERADEFLSRANRGLDGNWREYD